MRTHHKSSIAFIPLFLFIALFTALWSSKSLASFFSGDETPASGTPLPAFNLATLTPGKHLKNSTFLGHVSLLNIWASWCSYCRSEHDTLLYIRNNSNTPIYGIDFRDNVENAKEMLATKGNPYTMVGVDWNGDVTSALGEHSTPITFIIDKHGNIRYRFVGSLDQTAWNNDLLPLIKKYETEK